MRAIVTLCLLILGITGQAVEPAPSARLLVHLLSYLKEDYALAVQGGKVISAPEYQEQVDFAAHAKKLATELTDTRADTEVQSGIATLEKLILDKADPSQVGPLAGQLGQRVLLLSKLEVAPTRWPDQEHGRELYQKNCAYCHGNTGHGDGPSASGLDPKPTDFHGDKMDGISPFQAFNTIRLGVPGTAMAAYPDLSDHDVWDLAFYVVGLRYEKAPGTSLTSPPAIELSEVASSSDEKLRSRWDASQVAAIRKRSGGVAGDTYFLGVTRTLLGQALDHARKGEWAQAKQAAVLAYLDGIEPIEPRLRAKDASFVFKIEEKMASVRAAIDSRATEGVIRSAVDGALAAVLEAEKILAKQASSWAVTLSVALGIVLREAFEAILLLVTLLGVIRSLGSQRAAFAVHAGWLSALGAGALAWVFSGWVLEMSGADRELLEGTICFIAVLVLVYFGFWLHRKTEVGRWRAFIQEMVATAVAKKSLLVLFGVAFMAVFREAFETVLFLRALLLESGESQGSAVAIGVSVALIASLAMGWALVRFSVRLPLRQLFSLSSFILLFLAFVLIGKGVRAFQETGILSITPLGSFRVEWLGIFPTVESLLPQAVLIAVWMALWTWERFRREPAALSFSESRSPG